AEKTASKVNNANKGVRRFMVVDWMLEPSQGPAR
ncbi:MAG: hypothetical protein RIQ79_1440, partial [Verrucomicrobiota bacterium]